MSDPAVSNEIVQRNNGCEEALQRIRIEEQVTGAHLPAAYSMRGGEKRFRDEGFDGNVSKPFVIDDLTGEMRRVLDNCGAERGADRHE